RGRRNMSEICFIKFKPPKKKPGISDSGLFVSFSHLLAANPDAVRAPAVAIPDTLVGPITARAVVGAGAVIGRAIITTVIRTVGGDAAENGAGRQTADDAGGDSSAAGFGRLRGCHGRDGKSRGSRDCSQSFRNSGHGVLLYFSFLDRID